MKSIIVFDGIQLIMAVIAVICGIILLIAFLLDGYFRRHPRSRFKNICYKIFGVDKDLRK